MNNLCYISYNYHWYKTDYDIFYSSTCIVHWYVLTNCVLLPVDMAVCMYVCMCIHADMYICIYVHKYTVHMLAMAVNNSRQQ